MFAQITSSALWGISAKLVKVEAYISNGLPSFCIVGLPDVAIRESRDRVIAAIKNSQLELPTRRIIVNLAPASLRKEGPAYDLPIALAILAASEQIPREALKNHLIFGELSLDGRLRSTRGSLALACAAHPNKTKRIILPASETVATMMAPHSELLPMPSLRAAVDYFRGHTQPQPLVYDLKKFYSHNPTYTLDFSEVNGQLYAKRALEVAAAGGHNILMVGPPGSGKTMLSQRLPTILPELSLAEAIETTRIYSLTKKTADISRLILERPFRAPHHTLSNIALIGGGSHPKPGEVSLAHNGVLFLDELPEFSKQALEVLRQPLEAGQVTISRAAATVHYPARFLLVAAMNPCPCGYATEPNKECTCTPLQIKKYMAKISGPLWDRFDIQLEVPSLKYQELLFQNNYTNEISANIRKRVKKVRKIQLKRYKKFYPITTNAHISPKLITTHCTLDNQGLNLLKKAMEKLKLSARAYHKILRLARTIADLDNSENIQVPHLAEAIQYRSLDKIAGLKNYTST